VIMAGIDTLIRGAVGSLAKDKITSQLTPTQMELASFILNPQYYLAEKGVNKIADILGYGGDLKTVQADAKTSNQYYKEIMRDALGNVLPDSLGNIIRSNPKIPEADQEPAGEYIAWDPATESWTQQASSNPISRNTSSTFDDFLHDLNAGNNQPVGPLEEYDQKRLDDEYDFQTSLSNFQPGLNNYVDDLGEITVVDQKPASSGGNLSYTEMIDVLNSPSNVGGSSGLNLPITESLAPAGSVYDASIGANTPITESSAPIGSTYEPNLGMNVPATATPSMPDYSRAYSALGGAEIVNNLRDQFLNMGLDENTIGSVFSKYYAPEAGNEGIKSIFSEAAYRNGGFLNRGGR
jgi:hypothetical protein